MKVKIEHEMLDSKIATAAALYNEWIKWCDSQDIRAYALPHITSAFEVRERNYNGKK